LNSINSKHIEDLNYTTNSLRILQEGYISLHDAYTNLKDTNINLVNENNNNKMMLNDLDYSIFQHQDKIISLKYKIYELSKVNSKLITELNARKES